MNKNHKFGSLYDIKQKGNKKNSNLFDTKASNLFFEPFSSPIIKNDSINDKTNENQKFLNDIDSTLIMENVDNTATNKVVKIDLKLKNLSRNIDKINEELKVLELFNLEKDKVRREELTKLKQNLLLQIQNLKSEKQKYGIIYILSAYTNNRINIYTIKKFVAILVALTKKYYNIIFSYLKKQRFVTEIFKTR